MTNGTDTLLEIARRLATGESPSTICRSLVPPSWAPVLRACAAARTFTSVLYDEVLHPWAAAEEIATPSLDDLLSTSTVHPVAGEPGSYALADEVRSGYFHQWFDPGRPELTGRLHQLEERIAGHLRTTGDETEELRHLLLPSPDTARVMFERLFTEADRLRDFPACQDLIDVLADADRGPRLPNALQEVLADRAGYVRARSYWAADYARAAQFLLPRGLERNIERWLGGRRRVWQLYGQGGAGKTMQLRWIVARYCVPEPNDVPCARIDFDVISARAVGRHPWLVLLEIADQFDRRLPGRPFERLDDYAAYRILLARRPSPPAREAAQNIASLDSAAVEEELVTAFAERLNRARPQGPAVLVVDTMEELLLHGQQEAERFLRLLGRLLQSCPGLRLALASRNDLRERLPQAMDSFGRRQTKHSEVAPLSVRQAMRYLRLRGIRDNKLAHAAADMAGGLPLKLALYADAIDQEPTITEQELRGHDEPHLRYLIDRVVERIDDPAVRWLLRYGVVPRRLRLEEALTVMEPWLAAGISGRSGADNPRNDRHHRQGSADIFPTVATAPTEQDLRQAWRRLLDYASSSSWVSRHAGDDSVVVFHTNVLAPMRQLVADQRVSQHLHQAFIDHFEALAETDAEQWVACTKEALYHRFQIDAGNAAQVWQAAVERMQDHHRVEAVRELSEEILGPEYVDDGRPRLRLDGEPLISHATLVQAHLAIAMSLAMKQADNPEFNSADPMWNEIEHRLALVDRLREHSPDPVPTASAEVILRAGLQSSQGMHAEAAELVLSGLESETDGKWRERLLTILARIQTALAHPDAESTYRRARVTARERGAATSEALIALELAQELERGTRLDQAFALQDSVLAMDATPVNRGAAAGTDPRAENVQLMALQRRALLGKARNQLRTFTPTGAIATLTALDPDSASPLEQAEACLALSQAYRQLGHSRAALASLDEADMALAKAGGPAKYRHLARNLMARGVLAGELLAVDTAQAAFDRAAGLWSDLGFPHGHPECLLLYARFLARDLGDLHQAATALTLLRTADVSGTWSVQRALLWSELHRQGYEVDGALRAVPLTSPQDLLQGGVAAVLTAPERVSDLADALAKMQPPAARLAVLEDLAWCPSPGTDDGESAGLELLHPLFDDIIGPEPLNSDELMRCRYLAEFARVRGRFNQALQLTVQADQELGRAAGGEPLQAWRQARAHLRLDLVPGRELTRLLCSASPQDAPLLTAVSHWLHASAEPADSRENPLRAATEFLSQVHRPSAWTARILHSSAALLGDTSTQQIANRMAAHLGHPVDSQETERHTPLRVPSETERVISPILKRDGDSDPTLIARSLLDDWRHASAAGCGRLQVLHRGRPPLSALQLQSDDTALHAFPWELADLPSEARAAVFYRTLPDAAESADTRVLQMALKAGQGVDLVIDGVFGALTDTAITAGVVAALPKHMSNTSKTLVSVLVATALWKLRESARSEYGAKSVLMLHCDAGDASAHSALGRAPAKIFESHGCTVRRLRAPAALPPPRKGPPALLHVCAPLRLKSGSIPYFDLSPAGLSHGDRLKSKASGSDLEPSRLVEWLAGFVPGTQPLIVLDPPRPASPADIPLQLVLRNLFAATLFASGIAPAVVGCGLIRTPLHQTTLLAQAIAEEQPLHELHRALRSAPTGGSQPTSPVTIPEGVDWGQDVIETLSAALFATPAALRTPERT